MKIDLSRVEQEPLGFREAIELDPERLDCEQVAATMTVHLEGKVRTQGQVFQVSGRCVASGPLVCSRCLEPVPWSLEEPFTVAYRPATVAPTEDELGLEEEDLDVVFLEETRLDLAELAVEQVLLALPMRVLCDDNCAGLCPRCGANRNHDGACRCEPEVDPRWQALDGLADGDLKS
ncbi:MAG: DUF177 domain-containing protein [Thermoanaerobaculales bacterium]